MEKQMKKSSFFSVFLLLFISAGLLIKTPTFIVVGLRGQVSSVLSPFWVLGEKLSHSVSTPINQISNLHHLQSMSSFLTEQNDALTLENTLLKEELLKLRSSKFEEMTQGFPSDAFEITKEEQLLGKIKSKALVGKIIYRNPASWSSSLWIDLGEEHNSKLDAPVIALNSPVTSLDSFIGVIDYVGKKQSRIRLITDSGMVTPVRASRGKPVSAFMTEKLRDLQYLCSSDLTDLLSPEEKKQFSLMISSLIEKLSLQSESFYLAKGELKGKSLPLWRSYQQTLEGTGFNYDFSDEKGSSISLNETQALSKEAKIISRGDLLVTSGLDGFLPPGLKVGLVKSVSSLKEGAYYFSIDATPSSGSLNEITTVSVLPPLNSIPLEQTL
jgi:rod shape-determining protein MreC